MTLSVDTKPANREETTKRRRGGPKPRTEITPKQHKAIELILMGRNMGQVAGILGVDYMTVVYWRKQEPFKKAFAEALETIDSSCAIDVRQLVRRTYQEIEGLLQDPNPMVRLGACRLTLEAHSRMVQQLEEKEALRILEARLEEVQAAAMANINTTPTGHLSPAAESVVEAQVVEVGPTVGPEEPGEDAEAQ